MIKEKYNVPSHKMNESLPWQAYRSTPILPQTPPGISREISQYQLVSTDVVEVSNLTCTHNIPHPAWHCIPSLPSAITANHQYTI